MQETQETWGSIPGLGRSPGGGNGNLLRVLLTEKSHRQRSLMGYSLWGHKELNMTEYSLTIIIIWFVTEWYLVRDLQLKKGFPNGSYCKESVCNARHLSLIPRLGRSPGERNSYPLQYSCQENFMDRRALQAAVHGIAKGQTWLSNKCFEVRDIVQNIDQSLLNNIS